MKRPHALLLSLMLALPAAHAQEKVKIIYWAWTEHVAAAKAALPEFQKQNPNIEVDIVNLNPFDLQDKFLISLASGVGAPDVALILQRRYSSYLETGALLDTTKYVNPVRNSYPKFVYNSLLKDGKVYGFPYDQNPSVLFYRKDVFQANNIKVPIQTWDEFLQVGKKLSDPKKGIYMGWVSSPSGVPGVAVFVQYLQSRNAQIFDKNGKVITGNTLGKQTLNFYYSLAQNNIALQAPNNSPELFRALKEGRLLTYAAPAYSLFRFQSEAPDFAGKWGVMPWPKWSKSAPATTGAWGGNVLAIPKQTKNASAAIKWARFLSGSVTGQEQLWQVGKLFPSYIQAIQSSKVQDGDTYIGGQSIYQNAIKPRKVNDFNYFDWAQAETIIGRELDLMFAGQQSADQAWDQIENNLKRQLRR